MKRKQIRWRPEAERTLRVMYLAGEPVYKIGEALGVSTSAAAGKISHLRLPKRAVPTPPGVRPRVPKPPREHPPVARGNRRPFELTQEQRARLDAPPRDLAGALFGDPPVGYSALERRP